MEIFFDEKYLTIQDNENYIFYFGNLNKAIKLNYYNTYCLQQIFSNITNNIIDLSMLCFIVNITSLESHCFNSSEPPFILILESHPYHNI